MTENCNANQYAFNSTIVEHPTEKDQLLIANFYDSFDNVYAVLLSESKFEIPLQLHDANRIAISGMGTYIGSVVEITYEVEDVAIGSTDDCKAIYSK